MSDAPPAADAGTLEVALDEAYRTWSLTGFADVPGFDASIYDAALLAATATALEAVALRCVISRTKATWLRRVMD